MKNQLLIITFTVFILCACTNTTEAKRAMITKSDLQGTWLIEYIEQKPVIDRSPATIMFDNEGRIAGNSSCNRFRSSYHLVAAEKNQNTKLSFGKAGGTMMMCSETLMNQEQRFLKALTKVTQVTIENGMLILLDDNQQLIFKASAEKMPKVK